MFGQAWSEEEIEILRDMWPRRPIAEVAAALGRRENSIKCKAHALGLGSRYHARRRSKMLWTQEEIAFLRESWPEMSPEQIGRRLERTRTAVLDKAGQLGLGTRLSRIDGISAAALLRCIRTHASTDYMRFFASKGLRLRHMRDGKHTAYVRIDDFWRWARSHVSDIQLEAFTPGLLGVEPEWMGEIRAERPSRCSRIPWTDEEDRALLREVETGEWNERELAERHGRSANAIRTRLGILGSPYRPLPIQLKRRPWSKEDERELRALVRAGWCADAIARRLERSAAAVSAKIGKL